MTFRIDEAIYVEPDTGLHVLMTRPSERAAKINAADVLASARFGHLVADLARTYDLVVLDAPPTLVVAENAGFPAWRNLSIGIMRDEAHMHPYGVPAISPVCSFVPPRYGRALRTCSGNPSRGIGADFSGIRWVFAV